jgi:hypothetical protein
MLRELKDQVLSFDKGGNEHKVVRQFVATARPEPSFLLLSSKYFATSEEKLSHLV